MEISTFLENFASQFEDTDISIFKEDTIFKDLEEWNSLTALSIIAMADEKYNIKLTGDDIRNASTVSDLYSVIKSKS